MTKVCLPERCNQGFVLEIFASIMGIILFFQSQMNLKLCDSRWVTTVYFSGTKQTVLKGRK